MDFETIKKELETRNYIVLHPVATGRTSECFLVRRVPFNQIFICKCIHESKEKSANIVFENEVSALVKLDHENIIRCYDYFNAQNYYFILLEYCNEGTLEDLIENNPKFVKENMWNFAEQIISALVYTHEKGICHLDLKPSNILINQAKKLKISDFGFCYKFTNDEKYDINSYNPLNLNRRGSPQYMAPEVYKQNEEGYDPFKADIWSLGVILYNIATADKKIKYGDIKKMWVELYKNCANLGKFGKVIQHCACILPENRPSITDIQMYFLQNRPPVNHLRRASNSMSYSLIGVKSRIVSPFGKVKRL